MKLCENFPDGVYDKTKADELNISDDEFWNKNTEYEQRTKRIMFTPFANMK